MDLSPAPIIQSFLARVERAFGGEQARVVAVQLGRSAPKGQTTATGEIPRYDNEPTWFDWQAIEASRIERYRDLREARVEVFEWDKALAVRRGYCFNSKVGEGGTPLSYAVTYGRGARKEVQSLCDAVTDRLGLHSVVPDIYDAGQWLGDSFDELVFETGSRALVDIRHWEPERVVARTNRATGRISHYSIAVGNDWDPTQAIGDRINVPPFLLLHYAPNRRRGQVYGWSCFGSGRKERREYEASNDTLVMGQALAIATEYLLWPFPREQNPDIIWRWINRVRQSVELNLQFNKDGVLRRRLAKMIETSPKVMPYLVDPDLKDPPTRFQSPVPPLEEMLKVAQWKQMNVVNAAGVPAMLLGLTRELSNRATATEEAAQFAVQMMTDQTEVAQDVISPIYVRALMAAGITPQPGEIRIEMFPPSQLYERMRADVAKVQAEACKIMVDSELPVAFALKRAFNMGDAEVTEVLGDVQTADVASVDALEAVVGRAIEAAAARFGGREGVTAELSARGASPVVLERG